MLPKEDRIKQLLREKGLDGAILSSPENFHYVTGFAGHQHTVSRQAGFSVGVLSARQDVPTQIATMDFEAPTFEKKSAGRFLVRKYDTWVGVKTWDEIAARPRTAAVIGAGFIGMEMAENLSRRGLSVSVVEAAAHVMAPIDFDMAHAVHNRIRSAGMALYTNSRCAGFTKDAVLLEDGRSVPADMVILSIGVAPETAFLQGSGVALGKRGEILVDEQLRTSQPGVFALGDAVAVGNLVTGKPQVIPLAGPANKQARIVADVICGRQAACILRQKGAAVYNLSGGYTMYDARAKDLAGGSDAGHHNCTGCGMQTAD